MTQLHDCRDAFAKTLAELARANPDVVAVCNDSVGSSKLVGPILIVRPTPSQTLVVKL